MQVEYEDRSCFDWDEVVEETARMLFEDDPEEWCTEADACDTLYFYTLNTPSESEEQRFMDDVNERLEELRGAALDEALAS